MNGAVLLSTPTPKPPRLSEILRYAGVRNAAEGEVIRLAEQCVAAAIGDLKSLVCYRVVDIEITHTGVGIGETFAPSTALARRLLGCSMAVVFAATVGQGLDRMIARAAKRSPAEALMLHALGAERVEAVCDAFAAEVESGLLGENLTTAERFSPGYGDLPLEFERDIFCILDGGCNKIGLTLCESMVMSPSKSVTAILGIKDN